MCQIVESITRVSSVCFCSESVNGKPGRATDVFGFQLAVIVPGTFQTFIPIKGRSEVEVDAQLVARIEGPVAEQQVRVVWRGQL